MQNTAAAQHVIMCNATAYAAESTASVAWLLSLPAAVAIVVAVYVCSTYDQFELGSIQGPTRI